MEDQIPKRERPHHATILFRVDIREMNKSGELISKPMRDDQLRKYGMGTKGKLFVSGPTEAACIKEVKKMMERMNG